MAAPSGKDPEKSIQQTLLEYQTIVENASVGILFTRDRKVLHCNPQFSAIYGWPHGELVGESGAVFYLSEDDYKDMGRLAGPKLASGELLDVECPMRRKDGSTVYCHMRAKAIDPRNTAAGTIWIVEDISDRRRAQAELQDLLLKQQAILENASVGITFTRNGEFVHCNPRAEAIYGWPPGTLVGQQGSVVFKDAPDYARFGDAVGQKLANGELVSIEWLNVRKDGSLFWCRNLAKALPTADGSRSTIWISEDISDRKAAEEALATAHLGLERRVEERTAELALINDQLQNEVNERKAMEKHLRAEEARFRDLTELSSDWFWEQDEELRFVEVKGAVHRSFLSTRSILGKRRLDMPLVGVSEAELQEHRKQLEARQPFKHFTYQFEVPSGSGKFRWFSISGKPYFEDGIFKGYRGTGTDITERKNAAQRIEFLAYHDALTGLPNRLLLQDRFQQYIAAAERNKTRIALVFADLDNFKKINDSLGHAAGDALLQEIAHRIRSCVRDSDTISRQGGDEFAIILHDLTSADSALPVLSKLVDRLQEPFNWEGQELATSGSFGVALYPDDGLDLETLHKKADMAMYRAKAAGRNTYRFFDSKMDDEAVEHLQIRNGLRLALARGEFQLYYQPQFDLRKHQLIGAEALLRWNHPVHGLMAPGRFIAIAEESGQIVPIGDWVIQEACRQARAWQQAGLPPLVIAVNLSAVQFRRGDVELTVQSALSASGLAPELLELELTESILIQDIEQVQGCVKRLNKLGVKLSIDDFGTGYSSLSYLKRFDIDKLKIDQSFIRDLNTDPDDVAIVRAIIEMAHSLGLRALAEGVETPEILSKLVAFGCDEAQGYHFARPMPADEFERYLSTASVSVS